MNNLGKYLLVTGSVTTGPVKKKSILFFNKIKKIIKRSRICKVKKI